LRQTESKLNKYLKQTMKITKVTIAGSGVLGSQIAFQTAFHGYAVMVYDISDDILEKSLLRNWEISQG
jgi:3-hydroxyacyl-CoA dehydrogenase